MSLDLTPVERETLVETAYDGMRAGQMLGIDLWKQGSKTAKAGEVLVVSRFCISLMEIARNWNTNLKRMGKAYALTVSTVFTHQTPTVKFKSPTQQAGCELADILIVVVDRTGPGLKATALFIQAKLSDRDHVALTGGSEKKQFELYAQNPCFNMNAGGPQEVQLSLSTASKGLRYGITGLDRLFPRPVLVHPQQWEPHAWYSSPPIAGMDLTYRVDAGECIAGVLVDMLELKAGEAFAPKSTINTSANSTWDDVINFLLNTTYIKLLTQNRANAGRTVRGESVVMENLGTSGGTFFVAHTPSSDPSGPVSWLPTDSGESSTETENWSGVSPLNLPVIVQSLVDQISGRERAQRLSGGGGDDGNPPVPEGQEYGSISTVVIEIVNNEGIKRAE